MLCADCELTMQVIRQKGIHHVMSAKTLGEHSRWNMGVLLLNAFAEEIRHLQGLFPRELANIHPALAEAYAAKEKRA